MNSNALLSGGFYKEEDDEQYYYTTFNCLFMRNKNIEMKGNIMPVKYTEELRPTLQCRTFPLGSFDKYKYVVKNILVIIFFIKINYCLPKRIYFHCFIF